MNKFALLVRLEAAPGKEAEVERLLTSALAIVEKEEGTKVWYALRFGPSSFGIFDAFPDQEAREDHLAGRVAAALTAKAKELFAEPPVIERVEILAEKVALPGPEIAGPPVAAA